MDTVAASEMLAVSASSSLWRLLPSELLFIAAADAAVSACVCVRVHVRVSEWVGGEGSA